MKIFSFKKKIKEIFIYSLILFLISFLFDSNNNYYFKNYNNNNNKNSYLFLNTLIKKIKFNFMIIFSYIKKKKKALKVPIKRHNYFYISIYFLSLSFSPCS